MNVLPGLLPGGSLPRPTLRPTGPHGGRARIQGWYLEQGGPPSSEKACSFASEPVLKHRRLWVRVSAILAEALPMGHACKRASFSGPLLHFLKVFVQAMMMP